MRNNIVDLWAEEARVQKLPCAQLHNCVDWHDILWRRFPLLVPSKRSFRSMSGEEDASPFPSSPSPSHIASSLACSHPILLAKCFTRHLPRDKRIEHLSRSRRHHFSPAHHGTGRLNNNARLLSLIGYGCEQRLPARRNQLPLQYQQLCKWELNRYLQLPARSAWDQVQKRVAVQMQLMPRRPGRAKREEHVIYRARPLERWKRGTNFFPVSPGVAKRSFSPGAACGNAGS